MHSPQFEPSAIIADHVFVHVHHLVIISPALPISRPRFQGIDVDVVVIARKKFTGPHRCLRPCRLHLRFVAIKCILCLFCFFFGVGLSAPEGLASVAVTVALFGQFDLPDLPLLDFCCGFSSSAIAVLMRRAAPCFLFSVMGAGYIGLRYIVFFICNLDSVPAISRLIKTVRRL